MVEIVDGGDRKSSPGYNKEKYQSKKDMVVRDHSYATERTLRDKCDSEIKRNPGMKSVILGKNRKY